jgi:hypothetical protein
VVLPVTTDVLSDLAVLLQRGGSLNKIEYVPELRSFVVHWIGPDATRCSATAPNLENLLRVLVNRIENADTEPPPPLPPKPQGPAVRLLKEGQVPSKP